MSNLILKHYFFTAIERITIEDALLNHHLMDKEDLLGLDDYEIVDLYHKVNLQSVEGLLITTNC